MLLVEDTQKTTRRSKVGRKKIEFSVKRTLRFDQDVAKMLEIYAERNHINVTTATNLLLRTQLSAYGLMDEAKRRIEQEDSDND
jgi:hypothetical protein